MYIMYVCIYVLGMYECMYVRMYVCMYVCMYVFTCNFGGQYIPLAVVLADVREALFSYWQSGCAIYHLPCSVDVAKLLICSTF